MKPPIKLLAHKQATGNWIWISQKYTLKPVLDIKKKYFES